MKARRVIQCLLVAIAVLATSTDVSARRREGYRRGVHEYLFSNGNRYSGEWKDFKPSGRGRMMYANGNSYEGSWSEGQRDGEGVLRFPDGTVMSGNWSGDLLNGHGSVKYPDGSHYEGMMKDSQITGKGEFTYADKSRAVGDFINGKPGNKFKVYPSKDGAVTEYERKGDHLYSTSKSRYGDGLWITTTSVDGVATYLITDDFGKTKLTGRMVAGVMECDGTLYDSAKDCIYQGHFRNKKLNGEGYAVMKNGTTFKGIWKDGVMWNGKGTVKYSDGDKYEGEFRNGKYDGIGTYTYANGDRFTGEWMNGKKSGKGSYFWINGDRYEGMVRDNNLNGQGTFVKNDGGMFTGYWRDGEKMDGQLTEWRFFNRDGSLSCIATVTLRNGRWDGHGTVVYANGDRYEGEFLNDLFHGQGTLTYANGEVYSGQWVSNRLISQF